MSELDEIDRARSFGAELASAGPVGAAMQMLLSEFSDMDEAARAAAVSVDLLDAGAEGTAATVFPRAERSGPSESIPERADTVEASAAAMIAAVEVHGRAREDRAPEASAGLRTDKESAAWAPETRVLPETPASEDGALTSGKEAGAPSSPISAAVDTKVERAIRQKREAAVRGAAAPAMVESDVPATAPAGDRPPAGEHGGGSGTTGTMVVPLFPERAFETGRELNLAAALAVAPVAPMEAEPEPLALPVAVADVVQAVRRGRARSRGGAKAPAGQGARDEMLQGAEPAAAADPGRRSHAGEFGNTGSVAPVAEREGGGEGGAVILDGRLVGEWLTEHMGREAGRPSAGTTFFDVRQGPAWTPAGAL